MERQDKEVVRDVFFNMAFIAGVLRQTVITNVSFLAIIMYALIKAHTGVFNFIVLGLICCYQIYNWYKLIKIQHKMELRSEQFKNE